MTIGFKLDKENLSDFYARNIIETMTFKVGRGLLVLFVLSIIFLVWRITDDKGFRIEAIVASLTTVIFFKIITRKSFGYMFNKKYDDFKKSGMFDMMEMGILKEYFYIINSIEKREISYESISSINISENYMFIILSRKQYFIIPLDSFKTSEDKKAFRELLEEKTSLKAKYEYPDGLKYI